MPGDSSKKFLSEIMLCLRWGLIFVILLAAMILYKNRVVGEADFSTGLASLPGVEAAEELPVHIHYWETEYPDHTCMQSGSITVACSCGKIWETIPTGIGYHSPQWVGVDGSNQNREHQEAYTCKICGEVLETRTVKNTIRAASGSGSASKKSGGTRFHVPSVGINVGLISSYSQSAADKKDGAAYFATGSNMVIADPNYQDFKVLPSVRVGDTAYIETDGVRQNYICTEIHKGYRGSDDILAEDGTSLLYDYQNCLIAYTCIGRAATHQAFAAVFKAQ